MIKNYFSKLAFTFSLLLVSIVSSAQVGININTITPSAHPLTIPQTSTGYTGNNGQDAITFVINNTNSYPAIMDTIKNDYNGGGTATISLWYSASSLSGPTTPSAPAWTQIVSVTGVTIVANQLNTVLTGLNFSIPGNTRYRFQLRSTGVTLAYTTATGTATTPDSFNNSGVALMAGDYQINAQNVGYGAQNMAFTPRAFTGEVGFSALLSTPCTGQPNHDTIVGNMTPCPGVLSCYSLAGNNPNSGLSFQWLQSTVSANGPWSIITGDTNSFSCLIPPQPGPTWYTCVTTCDTSMLSDTATAIMVTPATFSPFSPCYCGNSTATITTLGDIGQFSIGTLTNPSIAPPLTNNANSVNGYSNFDTLTPIPTFIQGQSYPISMQPIFGTGFTYNGWTKAWIDYDHNTSWNAPQEEILNTATAGTTLATGNFTVPTTALPGLTRLRCVYNMLGNQAATQPCGTYNYGETEDYVVNILAAGPHDPAVTNIQAFPAGGCMDSCENVVVTLSNFGSQVLDLSINPLVVTLKVDGPNGLTTYVDTATAGFLNPFNTNSSFLVFPCVNFYEGGCYTINTDTLTILGSANTNLVNDSLFAAIQVCNSRPNSVDYNLCLGDTIPTGQGLGILNCPTGYVQDSVLIPFTLSFAGPTPGTPTQCAAIGAGTFGTGTLPTLPPGANMLSGEIGVDRLQLAPLTFTTGPNLTRFSLYQGTLPTTAANIYHTGLQGNPLSALAFGCFDYLSTPPAVDLNSMYVSGVPVNPTVNLGHWSTNRCTATNILANCGGTTTAYLKIIYEYIPMGISWYEQPSGGVRISDSSFLNPLLTANSIVSSSNTAGSYTFYGACAADTNCRVEVDLNITGLSYTSVLDTSVNCNGDSTGSIQSSVSGGVPPYSYSLTGPINPPSNASGYFSNLPAGSYTLNVLDGVGCSSGDSVITITEPLALVIDSIVSISPTCTPGGDGTMTVYASGGTGTSPYDSMSNGTSTITLSNQFTNQSSGTYTITVYDAAGCSATGSHTIVTPVGPSWLSVSSTNPLCFGDTSGTISVSATAGSSGIAAYTSTPSLTQLTAGNFTGATAIAYTLRATDSLNCFVDSVVTLTSPPPLGFASAVVDSTTCNGDSTGSITVLGSGGITPYTFTITPNVGNQPTAGSFTNLPANTYTVQLLDSNNNCTHDTLLTVSEPAVLTIDTLSVTDVACNGDSTGSIVLTSTGGTPVVTYSTPAPGIQVPSGTINGLPANTYVITGTDANLCSASTSVTISEPTPLVIDSIVSTTPSCVPGCDASLTVYTSGGTSPYQSYTNGTVTQASNIFINQCAGGYTITVIDGNGCSATSAHTISTPGAPSWTSVTSTDVLCFGDSNGSIASSTTGGTAPINFTISPDPNAVGSITTGNFTNLPAGSYTVTAVDANSCSIVSVIAVGTPAALSYTSALTDSVDCNGGSDGGITVVGSGGLTPYVYSLTPAAGSQPTAGNFTNLPANTYTVQLTDSNNCTLDTVLTVSQPDTLHIASSSLTQVACHGDSSGVIVMSHTGGTPAVSYVMSPVNGSVQSPSGTFSNVPAGTYTITGTDANSCVSTATIVITEPSPLQITTITSTIPSCVPGMDAMMTVTATGGSGLMPYDSMSIGSATIINNNVFSNLGGGLYTVTVYDANGCTATSSHTISTPGAPSWNTIVSDSVDCNGGSNGSITVTTTGGTGSISYLSSPAATQPSPGNFTGLAAGSYTITATDSLGCSITTNITIGEPAVLAISSTVVDSVACYGDSTGMVTIGVTGGTPQYTYSINTVPVQTNTTGIFNNLLQGSYTITVTDANNCSTSTSVTVGQPTALSYASVSSTNVSCNGANDGSISATGSGGTSTLSYSLSPTATQLTPGNFSGLGGNTYTITLSDINNCTLDSVVTIIEPVAFTIDTTSTTNILCFGDSSGVIVMNHTGGTGTPTYVISPNAGTQAPNGTFSNLPFGTYTITATDSNNCSASSTMTLSQPSSAVQITNITGVTPSCNPGNDGTLTITASGGTGTLQYGANLPQVPYQGGSVLNNLPGGLYVVYVQDGNGCVDTMSYNLVNSSAPAWSSVTSSPAICNGDSTGSITGLATGGTGTITYALAPSLGTQAPVGTFSNLPAGSYSISASDANNCSVVSAVTVSEPSAITFTSVVTDSVDCTGGSDGSIVLTSTGGTGALSYSITPASTQSPPGTFSGLGAATYTVTITDSASCTVDSMIVVSEPVLLSLSSTLTNILCFGDSSGQIVMSHTGGTGTPTYGIVPNVGTQSPAGTFSGLAAGSYTITATDANSCVTTSTYSLSEPVSAVQISTVSGITPSCSPGGDGVITVTASGGTGTLQYNLNASAYQSSNQFTGLNSTSYLVYVQDSNACVDTMTYVLPSSGSPSWTSTVGNAVLCNGDSSGSLALAASGGTGTISYTILSPAFFAATNTSGSFLNLPANTYTVEARDTNNCFVLANIVVGQPTTLFYSGVSGSNVSCTGGNNGSIVVSGTGGTTPYSYTIAPVAIQLPVGTFINLLANTYAIQLTDSNGCTLDTTVTITEPTQITVDSTSSIDVLCNGDSSGSLYIQSSGGTGAITYSIPSIPQTSTSGQFSNLLAGTYTVVSTDANNCFVNASITVTEPTPLTHSVSGTDVLCNGDTTGTITLSGSGGIGPYGYSLTPNVGSQQTAGNFSGLAAGNYIGVVTDNNACTDTTATIVISEPTQLVFGTATTQDIDCFGASTGSIGIAATGGTGVKNIELTGAVTQGPFPSPANFSNLPAGTYTLTVTDGNNCVATTTVTLTQNPQIFFSSITNKEEICYGDGTAEITFQGAGGVGGFTYVFNNGNPPGSGTPSAQTTYVGLAAGSYNIEAIDALGCRYDSSYTLLGPDPITWPTFDITPTTCLDTEDGKLTVIATGGRGSVYTYSLEPGFYVNTNGLFRDLAPRQYTLRTTDTAGCFVDTIFSIPLPSDPMVVSITKEDLGCHGRGNEGKAEAIVTGGTPPYTYLWSSTPVQITPRVTGLYQGYHTVEVVDARGCLERDTIVIEPGPCCQEVFLPNAFSPNGDGRNDEFRILSTAGMELQQFEVRNRWGIKIWESQNVRTSWDGTYGGKPVDVGTYYYVMRYKCLTDGQNYTMKGDVIIVR